MSLDSPHWSGTWSDRGSRLRRRGTAPLSARVRRFFAGLAESARRLEAALTIAAAHRARREALGALDDRTLRDIGISRSEIGSVVTESLGLVEPTRVQILQSMQAATRPGAATGHVADHAGERRLAA